MRYAEWLTNEVDPERRRPIDATREQIIELERLWNDPESAIGNTDLTHWLHDTHPAGRKTLAKMAGGVSVTSIKNWLDQGTKPTKKSLPAFNHLIRNIASDIHCTLVADLLWHAYCADHQLDPDRAPKDIDWQGWIRTAEPHPVHESVHLTGLPTST